MKFLCDQMLGTLAKWLRLFGYDTFYADGKISDNELLDIAQKEKRILITRDKLLTHIGRKKNLDVIKIKSTDIDEQLKIVLKNNIINEKQILKRCSICNNPIKLVNKNEIIDRIPKRVFENNEKFWYCNKCNKIYWTGTHYNKIIYKINKLKNNL